MGSESTKILTSGGEHAFQDSDPLMNVKRTRLQVFKPSLACNDVIKIAVMRKPLFMSPVPVLQLFILYNVNLT